MQKFLKKVRKFLTGKEEGASLAAAWILAATLVPSAVTATMQTTAISATSRPYSASEAPSSLPVRNLRTFLRNFCMDGLLKTG
jgi:hypothetical protein